MGSVVAVVGSYRKNHTTDKLVDAVLEGARSRGAVTRKFSLLEEHIEFCRNCRQCTQEPGVQRGECPQKDAMGGILDELERADAVVFASPLNFFNVTAVMRRFLERMVCYAYWPWGAKGPEMRSTAMTKKAALIFSSAAPSPLARWFTDCAKPLKTAAKMIGAKVSDTLYCGLAAQQAAQPIPEKVLARARRIGERLA